LQCRFDLEVSKLLCSLLDSWTWYISRYSAICVQEPWSALQHDRTKYATKWRNTQTWPRSTLSRKGKTCLTSSRNEVKSTKVPVTKDGFKASFTIKHGKLRGYTGPRSSVMTLLNW